MAMTAGALYEALKAANVDDEKARKAAEEVADYDDQLHGIRLELSGVRADLSVLKWADGLIVAGVLALIIKALI